MHDSIEDARIIAGLKAAYAPDNGAEREHNADDSGLGFGLVHYSLVRAMKPEHALVVGSRYGFIPACIAMALKSNGNGRLHFVDASYDNGLHGFETAYGGVNHWAGRREDLFRQFDLYEWIEMHIERTEEFFRRCDAKFQYVYLDGNHSYEGVKYDAEQSLARLSPGGIMTFHDALVNEPDFGVRDYLREEYPDAVILGGNAGLAMVQPFSGESTGRRKLLGDLISKTSAREEALREEVAELRARVGALLEMQERHKKGPLCLRQLMRHPKAFWREMLGMPVRNR